MNKIVIVGCGNVGMSYAYALLWQTMEIDELVLIDINEDKLQGEAMDLSHCLSYCNASMKIRYGTYMDCKNATLVCITAGVSQSEAKSSRMDDLEKAYAIYTDIVTKIVASGFMGIYLVAGNPLDIMTYVTWKCAGVDTSRVIGSGTTLDTARLRYFISERLAISPKSIDAYFIGEHGGSGFASWSGAKIGLKSIYDYLSEEDRGEIQQKVINSGFEIASKKGYTNYGVSSALIRITKAILANERAVLSVCSYDPLQEIFISSPSIIGKAGMIQTGLMNLSSEESSMFNASCQVIKRGIEKLYA